MRQDVSIPTPEGDARAFAFTPDAGQGPWPAAIIFMDAPAIRPALFEMGQRLADAGYYVLLPDLFWRAGPYPPLDIVKARAGDPEMVALFQKLRGSTGVEKQMADAEACLDWLATQPQARAGKVGVTGYCMGGSIALRAAGTFPDRIAAAASFHGGNMATDDEKSPHRLADRITAKVLVAGAEQDGSYDEAQDERLRGALKDAGVDAQVSIWPGCRHGWVPSDMPVHNPEGAERHWRELVGLFDGALK
ncbi:MAG: dienelactone hydrolase family protein [Phenylobacterium sp.]|uniref:dienelactone hydrolase family protein n=1 Tax=Phenylobacterium sp. TaxID=1871053 RepID=UPI0025DD9F81|nr:dienelactone hydrolase family protein [Phenylobacterium sp.]MBI1199051.1 dienelactone hydrolase family protein [Phenylobacterium sp.]